MVAWTSQVCWWRERAGSQARLESKPAGLAEGLNAGSRGRNSIRDAPRVFGRGTWVAGSAANGERIELVWLAVAGRCPLDLEAGLLVGSQEGKMLGVQGRSPSWRPKDEGHGGIRSCGAERGCDAPKVTESRRPGFETESARLRSSDSPSSPAGVQLCDLKTKGALPKVRGEL